MILIKLQPNPNPIQICFEPIFAVRIPETKAQKKHKIMQATSVKPQPQTRLKNTKVSDVTGEKRRLVQVPYTASLGDTMNALMANKVVAMPVAAPPGHWIGAGGSMILESDKQTGSVRKHYIGMVTMVDILAHIADDDDAPTDLDKKMSVPVSSIIGHCVESLSLWILNPNTSILDCMEVFSKGIHRALVPIDSHMENVAGVELSESASGYRMLTQMDLMRFLKSSTYGFELKEIMSRSVKEVGGMVDTIFGVSERARVIDAIECMRTASLAAVPIVESSGSIDEDHTQLLSAKNRRLKGTFSATDLRRCSIAQMQSCLRLGVLEFIEKLPNIPVNEALGLMQHVTCRGESPLGEVVDKAVTNHVHRLWVVDQQGLLAGVVSLTDVIRVIRTWLISEPM